MAVLNRDSIGNCHFSHFDSCDFCLNLEAAVSQAVISDCHLEEALAYRLRTRVMIPPAKPYWCYCVLMLLHLSVHILTFISCFFYTRFFFLSVTLTVEI